MFLRKSGMLLSFITSQMSHYIRLLFLGDIRVSTFTVYRYTGLENPFRCRLKIRLIQFKQTISDARMHCWKI